MRLGVHRYVTRVRAILSGVQCKGDPTGFCRLNSIEIRIRQPRGRQSLWDTLCEHCRTFCRIAHFTMRQTRYPWALTLCLVSFLVEGPMKISWSLDFRVFLSLWEKKSCHLPVSGFLMLFLICFAESETQKKSLGRAHKVWKTYFFNAKGEPQRYSVRIRSRSDGQSLQRPT